MWAFVKHRNLVEWRRPSRDNNKGYSPIYSWSSSVSWQQRRMINNRAMFREINHVHRNKLWTKWKHVQFSATSFVRIYHFGNRFPFRSPSRKFKNWHSVLLSPCRKNIWLAFNVRNSEDSDNFVAFYAKILVHFQTKLGLADHGDFQGTHCACRCVYGSSSCYLYKTKRREHYSPDLTTIPRLIDSIKAWSSKTACSQIQKYVAHIVKAAQKTLLSKLVGLDLRANHRKLRRATGQTGYIYKRLARVGVLGGVYCVNRWSRRFGREKNAGHKALLKGILQRNSKN